ncbi:unnamed protein product [Tuber aestivum]|uniref:Uncharacterized protein n=1 Tax=Tuber aestivum TaxID=59557 RepID=A0A292Q6L2_9PEZI|nr:unnamed protein product [Tuber aestivum]
MGGKYEGGDAVRSGPAWEGKTQAQLQRNANLLTRAQQVCFCMYRSLDLRFAVLNLLHHPFFSLHLRVTAQLCTSKRAVARRWGRIKENGEGRKNPMTGVRLGGALLGWIGLGFLEPVFGKLVWDCFTKLRWARSEGARQ